MTDQAEPPSRYPPADARRRLLARAIDLLVAFAPLLLAPKGHARAGEILSALLILCNDSLFGAGRSLGKRIAGLRVITVGHRVTRASPSPDGSADRGSLVPIGAPANVRQSFLRNWIFVFGIVPALAGRPLALSAAAFACVAAFEGCVALLRLTRDLGQRRLGDLFAGTQVIDASIAAGAFVPTVKAARAAAPLASRAARTNRENTACASR
jgi:uncharacterized RDD family membrane protein YckC